MGISCRVTSALDKPKPPGSCRGDCANRASAPLTRVKRSFAPFVPESFDIPPHHPDHEKLKPVVCFILELEIEQDSTSYGKSSFPHQCPKTRSPY